MKQKMTVQSFNLAENSEIKSHTPSACGCHPFVLKGKVYRLFVRLAKLIQKTKTEYSPFRKRGGAQSATGYVIKNFNLATFCRIKL